MRVVLGGGRKYFRPKGTRDEEHGNKSWAQGLRGDGRDLIAEWKQRHENAGHKAQYVWNLTDFEGVDSAQTDYLLGLFEPNHITYEFERENRTVNPGGDPPLKDLAKKAVEILRKNDKGFFLLVEGGRIDHGHHMGAAQVALKEAIGFSDAVAEVASMTSEDDTLLVVTGDHGHVFTIAGYSSRGSNILGVQVQGQTSRSTREAKKVQLLF